MSGQAQWAAALMDPARAAPPGLRSWNGSDPAQRFAVYRNNVTVSLIEALAETFPVTRAVVGESPFRALARQFARRHPPSTPVLADYGRDFPSFLAGLEASASRPELADLARLERAWLDAQNAADAEPVAEAALHEALQRPDGLPGLGLRLHPSLRVLRSRYAVVSLWWSHQQGHSSHDGDPQAGECAWILRRGLAVRVLPMSGGDCRFVSALQQGSPLGAAAERAGREASGFDLTRCLAVLLRERAITAIQVANPTRGAAP